MSLAYECDELLVARRASDSGAWSLSAASMDWSSRGGQRHLTCTRVSHAGHALLPNALLHASTSHIPPCRCPVTQAPLGGTPMRWTMR